MAKKYVVRSAGERSSLIGVNRQWRRAVDLKSEGSRSNTARQRRLRRRSSAADAPAEHGGGGVAEARCRDPVSLWGTAFLGAVLRRWKKDEKRTGEISTIGSGGVRSGVTNAPLLLLFSGPFDSARFCWYASPEV